MGDSQLRTAAGRGAAVTGSAARDFFTGASLLGRGLGLVLGTPRLLGLGLLPALITGLLYSAALVTLIVFIGDLSAGVTWFADDWSAGPRDVVRVLGGAALLGASGLLGVLTFTALTLLVGDPFYERISRHVEQRYGGVPGEVEVPFWPSLRRSAADSVRLIGLSILLGIPLFAAGFIPLVGQTVVPVLGGAVGGWILALELTGVPFERRGLRLRHRRTELRRRRPLALGFGAAVFACFLIPLGAVLLMPAAVAGAALLSRKVFDQPTEGRPVQGRPTGGRPVEGRPTGGRPVEGRPTGGRPVEGRPTEGRPTQGHPVEGHPVEGRPAEAQPTEGRPAEG